MRTCISIFLQRIAPQHAITRIMGWLAEVRTPWLKNYFIARFIRKYHVNMAEAAVEDHCAYATFNDFFIRQLKSGARPIAQDAQGIISPADGVIAQIGHIAQNQLLQAKGHYFDLESLLAGDDALAHTFYDGTFATIYLAPHNYHRVHMPMDGKLVQTIYVPGKLFSVNQQTADYIPHLYSRNERLICVFESEAGRFVLIFVGAMIVGSMQTAWMKEPVRGNQIHTENFASPIHFAKGDELGYFKLGSTVILLFEKNKMEWRTDLQADAGIEVGNLLGCRH
jgi:phosphatidylserine decarboxylase